MILICELNWFKLKRFLKPSTSMLCRLWGISGCGIEVNLVEREFLGFIALISSFSGNRAITRSGGRIIIKNKWVISELTLKYVWNIHHLTCACVSPLEVYRVGLVDVTCDTNVLWCDTMWISPHQIINNSRFSMANFPHFESKVLVKM